MTHGRHVSSAKGLYSDYIFYNRTHIWIRFNRTKYIILYIMYCNIIIILYTMKRHRIAGVPLAGVTLPASVQRLLSLFCPSLSLTVILNTRTEHRLYTHYNNITMYLYYIIIGHSVRQSRERPEDVHYNIIVRCSCRSCQYTPPSYILFDLC